MTIHQDARVYAGLFDGAERAEHLVEPGRHAYLHVASGRLSVNGTPMAAGDGARVRTPGALTLEHGEAAEVLLFDLRARERPGR